jgi:hypothetical protein
VGPSTSRVMWPQSSCDCWQLVAAVEVRPFLRRSPRLVAVVELANSSRSHSLSHLVRLSLSPSVLVVLVVPQDLPQVTVRRVEIRLSVLWPQPSVGQEEEVRATPVGVAPVLAGLGLAAAVVVVPPLARALLHMAVVAVGQWGRARMGLNLAPPLEREAQAPSVKVGLPSNPTKRVLAVAATGMSEATVAVVAEVPPKLLVVLAGEAALADPMAQQDQQHERTVEAEAEVLVDQAHSWAVLVGPATARSGGGNEHQGLPRA